MWNSIGTYKWDVLEKLFYVVTPTRTQHKNHISRIFSNVIQNIRSNISPSSAVIYCNVKSCTFILFSVKLDKKFWTDRARDGDITDDRILLIELHIDHIVLCTGSDLIDAVILTNVIIHFLSPFHFIDKISSKTTLFTRFFRNKNIFD